MAHCEDYSLLVQGAELVKVQDLSVAYNRDVPDVDAAITALEQVRDIQFAGESHPTRSASFRCCVLWIPRCPLSKCDHCCPCWTSALFA